MSRASTRQVHRFVISETARQIDARENTPIRYAIFYPGLAGLVYWVQQELPPNAPPFPAVYVLSALGLILLFALFRPWHQHVNVDLDAQTCRVEWRVFGFLPLRRKSHPMDERIFAVRRSWPANTNVAHGGQKASEGDSLGCLALMLPFPLNLIGLFSSGKKAAVDPSPRIVLVLEHERNGTREVLVHLFEPRVAEPLLRTLHDLLPQQVELPDEWSSEATE